MLMTEYRITARIMIIVKTRSEFRGMRGAHDTINMAAYSSDTMRMVRSAKPMGSLRPADTGMSL